MALLQISEPGASPDPHAAPPRRRHRPRHDPLARRRGAQRRRRVPARRRRPGDPAVGGSLSRRRPRREIGQRALDQAVNDPTNTIVSVKRLMGRGRADIDAAPAVRTSSTRRAWCGSTRAAGLKSPVEVSAEILATLRQRAEDTFDDDLFGAVVTVPAYFDDAQRQATKDAAELAGLNVLRLISEPTAAPIAYGLDNAREGLYAVYDLGGGTFDISLLRMTQGVFEVVATGGDSALGGDDIDAALAAWALARAASPPRRRATGAPRIGRRAGGEGSAVRATTAGHVRLHRCGGQPFELPIDARRPRGRRPAVRRSDAGRRAPGAARRQGRKAKDDRRRRPGRRLDPHAAGAAGGGASCSAAPPLIDLDPDEVVAHRRGDPGRSARRQRRAPPTCCCST